TLGDLALQLALQGVGRLVALIERDAHHEAVVTRLAEAVEAARRERALELVEFVAESLLHPLPSIITGVHIREAGFGPARSVQRGIVAPIPQRIGDVQLWQGSSQEPGRCEL